MRLLRVGVTTLFAVLFLCPTAGSQAVVPRWATLPALGGDFEDRVRLGHLLGARGSDQFLLRSPSDALPALPGLPGRVRWIAFKPDLVVVNNSAMPLSFNDGALWAARGWSEMIRAGLGVKWGRFSLVLAPELVATENLPYELPPPEVQLPRPPDRSLFSSPWHVGDYSIDMPLRFGNRGIRKLDFGQSTLSVDTRSITAGLSTENEWWGPGIRNALVLSNNGAGIWRAFVRTRRPIRTSIGTFAARWFLGGLFESSYFDSNPANDRRSITALAATWTPPGLSTLTVGATRAVYAPLERWGDVFNHTLDVFRDQGLRRLPGDTVLRPSRDPVLSLFARWVFPNDGFAVHGEWARQDSPSSLRELLVSPNRSQGYTLGLEWARPVRAKRDAVRVQAEVTYLEKSPAFRNLPESSWYTSAAAAQGYTQRGQVIGAAIGPGGSSQWLGVDYFAPTWRLGAFAGRIRWDDDALYSFRGFYENKWCAHDVSLSAGLTGALQGRFGKVQATLTRGSRLNVFFYHLTWCGPTAAQNDVLDVVNTTLEVRMTLSP